MHPAVRFALVAAGYALVAWSTLMLTRASGGIATIWIAAALAVGYVVHRPGLRLWPVLLAVVCAVTFVGLSLGRPLWPSFLGGLVNAFEVGAICLLLRRWGLRPGEPLRDRDVFAFLVVCVLIVPAVAAVFGASLPRPAAEAAPWLRLWVDWWRSDALGMFVFLPLAWTASRDSLRHLLLGPQALEFWALALATVVVVVAGLVHAHHPFVFIALPLLMVAVRAGILGTALCNALMIATVLVVLRAQQLGALPLIVVADDHLRLGDLWQLACFSAVGPLLVAFMSEQRHRQRIQSLQAAERLRVLTDALPAFVAEIGPDLRYRFVNARYSRAYGLPAEAIVGKTPSDTVGPGVAARLKPHLERALQGHPERFDVTMDDGTVLEAAYEPLPSSGGVLVLGHDVTWRHEADRRFRNLLESAPDAMLVVDVPSRHVVLVNEQGERIFGVAREAMLGEPIGRFIADGERLGAVMAEVSEGDTGTHAREVPGLCARRPDGCEFPVEVVLSRLSGQAGAHVVVAIRDVTLRRQAEDALRMEREQARVTLESIGDAVLTYDTARKVTSLNRIAEVLTGWPRAQAIGRRLSDIVRLHESASAEDPAVRTDERREASDGIYEATLLLRPRRGEAVRVEISDAPLRDGAGQVIGGVIVLRDISQAHAMAERMAYLAQHDDLTGLPNKRLLQDRLVEALRRCEERIGECSGALLFVDLDLFKHINDSLGHTAGDWVLQVIAERLVELLDGENTVSRQGGDEFLVLLPEIAGADVAVDLAGRLIRTIEHPVQFGDRTLHVSASVGITLFPLHGTDAKLLVKQADTALYHAKQAGRGRHSVFTTAMSERADQRLRLETELRAAIGDGQLFLEYQPKVRMPDRVLVGLEALVRWRHPLGHAVPPGDFIPVAEETGLVTAIDEWVLREACRQNRAWLDAGFEAPPIAVNISLARANVDRVLSGIASTLAASGLPASQLEVEFTESQMLGQNVRARQLVDGIRAMGVRLAVDDFGTGYSSLSYLTDFRFDTIKIDRAFVQGLPGESESRAVVQAILGIAHSLDCAVVAEGVETGEQVAALVELGCRDMQGFFFARPLPAAEIAGRLARRGRAEPVAAGS